MTKPESTSGGVVFETAAIEHEMRQEDAYAREGHTARTLTREADRRIVLVVMNTASRIGEHHAKETACVHALRGHLRLRVQSEVVELRAGQLLVLERGVRHEVEAVVESSFLLTLGWPNTSPR